MQSCTYAILVLLVAGTVGAPKTDPVPRAAGEVPSQVVADEGTPGRNYGEYLGTYDLGEHGAFGVSYAEGRLTGELSMRKGPVELFPTPGRPDHFFARAVPATFVFSRNDKGRVDFLVISVAGKGDMKGAKKQ